MHFTDCPYKSNSIEKLWKESFSTGFMKLFWVAFQPSADFVCCWQTNRWIDYCTPIHCLQWCSPHTGFCVSALALLTRLAEEKCNKLTDTHTFTETLLSGKNCEELTLACLLVLVPWFGKPFLRFSTSCFGRSPVSCCSSSPSSSFFGLFACTCLRLSTSCFVGSPVSGCSSSPSSSFSTAFLLSAVSALSLQRKILRAYKTQSGHVSVYYYQLSKCLQWFYSEMDHYYKM